MPLVPHRFLFRVAYPCRYVKDIPHEEGDALLDLPADCALDNFAALDGRPAFAEVRLAWNELGLGVQVTVRGKQQPAQGDVARPRSSDGLTLRLDTRDARTGHRGTRYCSPLHLRASGGGAGGEA